MARVKTQISLHEIDNYTFGTKEAKPEKDTSLVKRMGRMTEKYKEEGMRRTVECVLLLQNKQHPHVLLLQQGTRESPVFRLPGGRLRPGEGELEGTRRKLSSKLAPPREQLSQTHQAKWMVEEQLAVWWRPNFETLMCAPRLPSSAARSPRHFATTPRATRLRANRCVCARVRRRYPYLPAHVTKPKECKKLCMVRLSERMVFAVPKNFKLLAAPTPSREPRPPRRNPGVTQAAARLRPEWRPAGVASARGCFGLPRAPASVGPIGRFCRAGHRAIGPGRTGRFRHRMLLY